MTVEHGQATRAYHSSKRGRGSTPPSSAVDLCGSAAPRVRSCPRHSAPTRCASPGTAFSSVGHAGVSQHGTFRGVGKRILYPRRQTIPGQGKTTNTGDNCERVRSRNSGCLEGQTNLALPKGPSAFLLLSSRWFAPPWKICPLFNTHLKKASSYSHTCPFTPPPAPPPSSRLQWAWAQTRRGGSAS